MNGFSRSAFGLALGFFAATAALRGEPPDLLDDPQLLARVQDRFAEIVESVGPAVVAVTARGPTTLPGRGDAGGVLRTGSGVVIDADGTILTSLHVIEGADALGVTFGDGREVSARRVAGDRLADLAVIRIAPETTRLGSSVTVAELGDAAALQPGHIVLAFGVSPAADRSDMRVSVSFGLVCDSDRTDGPPPDSAGPDAAGLLRTSAHVRLGFSGGPLVDVRGRVVGVLAALGTYGADEDGGAAYAVPINAETRRTIQRLRRGDEIDYGPFGLHATDRPREDAAGPAPIMPPAGALVRTVIPRSPAARAGIAAGDIVVALDGRRIASAGQFLAAQRACRPGAAAHVDVLRDGAVRTVTVMTAPPDAEPPRAAAPRSVAFRGAILSSIGASHCDAANVPRHALLVTKVAADSPAGRAGLAPGDVIVEIDGSRVAADALTRLGASDRDVRLGLATGGSVLLPLH